MSSSEELAARLREEFGVADGEEDVEYTPLVDGEKSSEEDTSDEEEEEDIDTDEYETDNDDAGDMAIQVEGQADGQEITLSQHDLARLIMLTQSGYGRQSRRGFMGRGPPERAPANIPRLPKVPPHMDHELAFAVDLQTDATPNADPFSSVFAAASESKSLKKRRMSGGSSSSHEGSSLRSARKRQDQGNRDQDAVDSSEDTQAQWEPQEQPSMLSMLRGRERNRSGWTGSQQMHASAYHTIPDTPHSLVERMRSRAYICQFTKNGSLLVAAFQREKRVRVYETDNNFKLRKDVHCRMLHWTVTDTAVSPSQGFMLYSSITPVVHMVNLDTGPVESSANLNEIHDALHINFMRGQREEDSRDEFGVWSLGWAQDGQTIIAGTGNESVYVYDANIRRSVEVFSGAHTNDVNAVAFMQDDANIIVSGSDDNTCKLWDRRAGHDSPVGVFVGHSEGITHIDPKGDGRFFISNSKDQSIKLWDVRSMMSAHNYANMPAGSSMSLNWDYRCGPYPARGYNMQHSHNHAVMTYRGHEVLQTLIRAYWSPAHSTAQRYLYTGDPNGHVTIYDVVSGRIVHKLDWHGDIVRDMSWHPYQPMLISSAFDGTLCKWEHCPKDAERWKVVKPDDRYGRYWDWF